MKHTIFPGQIITDLFLVENGFVDWSWMDLLTDYPELTEKGFYKNPELNKQATRLANDYLERERVEFRMEKVINYEFDDDDESAVVTCQVA